MNSKAKELAIHDKDTGSSEIQIALLTEKIETLSKHIKQFKKDKHSSVGLLRAVNRRKKGTKDFGTRCEIKNVNSIKFMQMAIEYEANRQVDLIEDGQSVDQETRLFDTKKNETI